MFSMKYTSPKVTPKKGAAPPTPPSIQHALPLSSFDRGASPAVPNTNDGTTKSKENHGNLANGYTAIEQPIFHSKTHKRNGSSSSQSTKTEHQSTALTKNSILPTTHDDAASITMSENDSAVADVSEEEIEPRSNLLALLDRECVNGSGSGSGEGSNKEMHQSDEHNSTTHEDAVPETVRANNDDCVQVENNKTQIDDDDEIEDGVDFGQKNVIDDMNNLQATMESSSMNLNPKGYPYHRSASMEPMFDLQREESARTASSSSTHEESVYAAPIVGQTSLLSSSGSEENVATNDTQTMPPNFDTESKCTKPTSPTIYDMTAQPASPSMSEIKSRYGVEPMTTYSPATEATESEIGGDTYFDEPPAPQPAEGEKPVADSIEDDLVHVTLPPRVNRTNGYLTNYHADNAPFLPNCPSAQLHASTAPKQSSLPISPRQPFSHTHSLLDDCSDEEEETTSFTIVDSPTRHSHSYSCLPRQRSNSDASSPFSSYFKQQKQGGKNNNRHPSPNQSAPGASANQVTNNKIQHALLQTKHRRWDCQSAYAGSHAQSNQVFDLSQRVHYIVGYHGDGALASRLSVSVEAVRAAALASGLWRTVRLVRLPKGLFSSYSIEMEYSPEDNEVWALLKMLHLTFPMLDQVHFGGDISKAMKGGSDDFSADIDDEWRDELLACIMECLPNVVAIDGFVVEQEGAGAESRDGKAPDGSSEDVQQHDTSNNTTVNPLDRQPETPAAENSAACVDCEMPMCGLSDLVDSQVQNSALNSSSGSTRGDEDQGNSAPDDRAGMSSHAEEEITEIQDVSKKLTLTEADNEHETFAVEGAASHESIGDDNMRNVPLLSSSSSMLSSSRSWGSRGSSTRRPPTCPNSASRQRPKAVDQKTKAKESFTKVGGRLKRRVLGLIPSVSMLDDDVDEESDDSEENEVENENDCPTDLL